MPISAKALMNCHSASMPKSSCCWLASRTRLVVCASAWSAIHLVSLANLSKGTEAGFCAGQTNGWVFPERDWQSRLQNRELQCSDDELEDGAVADDEVDAHLNTSGESGIKGVVQNPQAAEALWRSYISLDFSNQTFNVESRSPTWESLYHSGAITNGSSRQRVSPCAISSVATRPFPFLLSIYRTATLGDQRRVSKWGITREVGKTETEGSYLDGGKAPLLDGVISVRPSAWRILRVRFSLTVQCGYIASKYAWTLDIPNDGFWLLRSIIALLSSSSGGDMGIFLKGNSWLSATVFALNVL